MRRKVYIILMMLAAFMLNGCTDNRSLENQAYVLVLGVDQTEDQGIRLTIQIPKLGMENSSSEGENQKKDSDYLIISAEGTSYESALERLKWLATRELNLSQIKMIVLSEALSRQEDFLSIVSTLAETYHLYTASRLVICDGEASDFINGHEAMFGGTLSNELDAVFDHYATLGCIPDGKFADVYYGLHSIYSDPMAIYGFASSESADAPALAMLGNRDSLKANTQSPNHRHYLGAVVLKNGQYAHELSAHDTLIANLLLGNLKSFNYDLNGQSYQLTPLEKPRTAVKIEHSKAQIQIKIRLSAVAQDSSLEKNDVAPVIEGDIFNTIQSCQHIGIEPFGFANKAALHFKTIEEWCAFDWHECFATAEVSVKVHVMRADA